MINNKINSSNWLILGTSVEGKSHIIDNIPCQDAHAFTQLNENWGIAVVSDGAGSYENSHLGSGFVVETSLTEFENVLNENNWHVNNILPTNEDWNLIAIKTLKNIKEKLYDFSVMENLEFKSLSCTVIVLIYSPIGLLVTHIGDGRAGYKDENDNWFSIITPFSGHQVGTTVFITTNIWNDVSYYIESNVINSKIKAFTLLTDGCELSCWECYQKSEIDDNYFYPNKPFPNFFNPNVNALLKMYNSKLNYSILNAKWENFIKTGNEKLLNETDDKTMILGVLLPKNI